MPERSAWRHLLRDLAAAPPGRAQETLEPVRRAGGGAMPRNCARSLKTRRPGPQQHHGGRPLVARGTPSRAPSQARESAGSRSLMPNAGPSDPALSHAQAGRLAACHGARDGAPRSSQSAPPGRRSAPPGCRSAGLPGPQSPRAGLRAGPSTWPSATRRAGHAALPYGPAVAWVHGLRDWNGPSPRARRGPPGGGTARPLQ